MQIILAWLLGAAFGGFTVWLVMVKVTRLYERWYYFCERVLERYLGVSVKADRRTGYISLEFDEERIREIKDAIQAQSQESP